MVAVENPVYYTITVNVIRPSSGTTTKIDGVVQSQKTVLAGTNHTILVTSSEIYYGSHYETINNIQHDETIDVRLPITEDSKRDHDPNFHLQENQVGNMILLMKNINLVIQVEVVI